MIGLRVHVFTLDLNFNIMAFSDINHQVLVIGGAVSFLFIS